MDDLLNGERAVLTPDAAGIVAYKRFRMADAGHARIIEADVWIGTRYAWDGSSLANAIGWSVGPIGDGMIIAIRLR